MEYLLGGELLRHEAQFDKRAYAVLQQAVVDLVDVRKIVDRLALRIFVVDSDVIEEDSVEADVLDVGDLLYVAQVATIALSEAEIGTAGAEHVFPKMWEGVDGSGGVDGDDLRGLCGRECC